MTAALAVAIAAAVALTPTQELRREKCAVIWQTVAPWSYSQDLVGYWCSEHERQGLPEAWYYSLVYGYTNFGLTVGREVNGAYGPCDVRWGFARTCQQDCKALANGRPWRARLLRDPYVNVRVHVAEMRYYHHRTGASGLTLLRRVFLPAAPHAGVVSRQARLWERTDRQFRRILSEREEER